MTEKVEVKVGQQFELGDLGKFRVSKLHGKEVALVAVGTKTADAKYEDGTLRYRRVATLELELAKRGAKAPAAPVVVEEEVSEDAVESDVAVAA